MRIFALLLLSLPQLAVADAANSDVVNERFPNPPKELEEHWKIDCAGARRSVLALSNMGSEAPDQSLLQQLLQDLNKCAMIYNVPGTASEGSCPDYGLARDALNHWSLSGLNPETAAEAVTCP